MSLLEKITGPEDIRKLNRVEMETLAIEVRVFILEKLSPIGGHLASSLGVVELTIALHAVFQSPEDKIIWDVGHQCYPHKILTGRKERFDTIRQQGGLSGFPKIGESEHDVFGAGHASTSISAALGMAVARDLAEKHNKVIAVIGDGSMNAGLAFEGLNHAGHEHRDLVVVLNDNEMSISPNVGALSSYLSRVMTGDFYSRVRKDFQEFLRAVPLGDQMAKFAKKVEEHAKGFITPGMLFEELGFTYVGPIDGHNIAHLLTAFNNIKKFKKPTLVHVITKKGKGFKPAEAKPTTFHGIGPFDPENGETRAKDKAPPSYTAVFGEALIEAAKRDPKIVAISAAMPEGTGLSPFAEVFPERFFDVGIAEGHAVTFAAGLATQGFKPVVAVYSTFMQRAYDQVIHDVALQNLPVVFAMDRAGLVGADGPTHHGVFDISFMRHIPNMTVMAPSDENELRSAFATALSLGAPAALRYPRGCGTGVDISQEAELWKVGRGRTVLKGKKGGVALLCVGTMVEAATLAAKMAKEESISVTVFDARFIKPLDEKAILKLFADSCGIVTVEENACQGGFGSAVLELLAAKGTIAKPVKTLGVPDRFIEQGTQSQLLCDIGLDANAIFEAIKEAAKGEA